MAVTEKELREMAAAHQRMMRPYTRRETKADRDQLRAKLQADIRKGKLELRIRKAADWLRTLEKVNERLLSQPMPECDAGWDGRAAYEQELARRKEPCGERIFSLLKVWP
jgi:hypothetical protein